MIASKLICNSIIYVLPCGLTTELFGKHWWKTGETLGWQQALFGATNGEALLFCLYVYMIVLVCYVGSAQQFSAVHMNLLGGIQATVLFQGFNATLGIDVSIVSEHVWAC